MNKTFDKYSSLRWLLAGLVLVLAFEGVSYGQRRGGGGGASRSAPSRSPSMSRPSPSVSRPAVQPTRPSVQPTRPSVQPTRPSVQPTRPSVQPTRPSVQPTRPSVQPTRPGVGTPSTRPGVGTTPSVRPGEAASRNDLSNFLNTPSTGAVGPDRVGNPQERQGDRIDTRDDRSGDRYDDRLGRQDNRFDNRDDRLEYRHERGSDIRNHVRDDYCHPGHPWNNWWGHMWDHHPTYGVWRVTRPIRRVTWGALGGWCAWGSTEPVNYYYGDNVVYEDDTVYVDEEPVATVEEYSEQATDLAASGATDAAAEGEWMGLGAYAIADEDAGDPTMFLQLAISKEGLIAGTLFNATTSEEYAVEGAVDLNTQRVAIQVAGQPDVVLETSIAGLTEEEADALVHFADDRTETRVLARLPEDIAD